MCIMSWDGKVNDIVLYFFQRWSVVRLRNTGDCFFISWILVSRPQKFTAIIANEKWNIECIHSYFVCDAQCITTYNRAFSNLSLFQVYTRVPEGDFIRVTGDSQRVYLKVKPFIEKVTADNISHSFLAQPFQYLKSQVCSSYCTTG